MKNNLIFLFLLLFLLPSSLQAGETIKCATTTSTRNSGILEYLLPIFTADSGITVQIIAVGTGAALNLGKKGDVDCVLVHAKGLELQLVDEGYFIDREDIMYNDFVILGPGNDPAGVQETGKAITAFQNIWESQAPFISRGDNSGTNMRENQLWASTGKIPTTSDKWYLSVGQGMAKTIRIASEKQAYTLSDRSTWLSMQDRDKLGLRIVLEGDPTLFNQYGAMAVNPAKHSHVNYLASMNFIIWMASPAGQQAIAAFKDSSGNTLFTPNAN